MARKVWFQLVDEQSRRALLGFRVTSVTSDAVNDIEDLRNKIHAEYDHTQPPGTDVLARVAAGQLRIYAKRAAYDAMKEPLDEDLLIGSLGGSKNNALIVEQLNGAEVGTVLNTPTTIFGAAFDNGLYIRQEYWDLHEIIQKRLAADASLRRILVVGSPGIGKSVFGVFLLLLFMMEKKHIAYRPLAHPQVHYFTWSSTNGYAVSDTSCAGITYEGFFDGNEAYGALDAGVFKHAFLFASPRTTNYHEFVKEKCFKVYMNPWTKNECQRFADAMKLEDHDEWFRRFNLVGGKPRFVFPSLQTLSSQTLSSETFDDLVQRVKEEIPHNLDELKNQVRLFQQKVFDDRMKHIVFHLYRNENAPSRAYLAYSSLVVEAIMNARYQVGSTDEIRALLQTPAPNLQSWRGKEIEKFPLQELATSKFV
ncbi:Hypothetical protein PHPALM_12371 [Phytophthora palmivora]|uniref:Crinkler (CRN) family protein n=1 Tax=Phytophthora palmivora TaxID=4796 RepID=A0A2P4XZX9_9STRA|nr:Hypothetical protein PHPALM_12371 [Phytophthora palmivora]